MDGTLLFLDTDWGSVRTNLQTLYDSFDLPVTEKGIFRSMEQAKKLAAAGKKDADEVVRKSYEILKEGEIAGIKGSYLREGARQLIDLFTGYKVALVTNNSMEATVKVMEKLGLESSVFEVIVAREGINEVKPSPGPVIEAIGGLLKSDRSLRNFVYIGDNLSDILAVKAARALLESRFGHGHRIVMVTVAGGATNKVKLLENHPDFFADDLYGVIELLKGQILNG
jgi:HAD superfamily hydrolase (TIGR01549 family)